MRRDDWTKQLRAAWDDADAVSADMLRKPRFRSLGPAKHRELYAEAADTIGHLLDNPPDDDAPEASTAATAPDATGGTS